MSTKGNLELRLNGITLYASTTHDGDSVYESATELVNFLDTAQNPLNVDFMNWFKNISSKVFPYNYSNRLIGGVPTEVVIDVPRKLLLHTYNDEFPESFKIACRTLKLKHNYQVLTYTQHQVRSYKSMRYQKKA
jgi:hypothetical protein